jgi:DNA-binding IclR family transcriptional regulator
MPIPGATISAGLLSNSGLASLARLDPVRLAGPVLDDLCERSGETVALAMWGNRGATCVRWLEAGGPVTVSLRTGVVLPLTSSATGLAFAAFYRSPYLRKMLDAEIQAAAAARKATPAALRRRSGGAARRNPPPRHRPRFGQRDAGRQRLQRAGF